MNNKELYKELTGGTPDFSSPFGIRKFQTFEMLLEDYNIETLREVFKAKDAIKVVLNNPRTWYNYEIEEVTPEVLRSHLKTIHFKVNSNFDLPAYWDKAMLKQATSFLKEFGPSTARYWMHKLERYNFQGYQFQGFLTFKFVRNWIEKQELK